MARRNRAVNAEWAGKPAVAAPAAGGDKPEACPTFTLRADQRGHLRALMAAMQEMPEGDLREALETLREFELYEEAHR